VRIAFGPGVFVNNTGLRMFLSGQMLELRYSGKLVVIRIVDHCDRLELGLVESFVLKLKTPIRQFPKLKIEELINRTRVNHLAVGNDIFDITVIGIQQNSDVWMISMFSNILVKPCFGIAWYVSVKYRSSRLVLVGTRAVTWASSSEGSKPHCFR